MPVRYGLIEPEDLPLPALPQELDGLRVAHLSDLHVSVQRPHRRRLDRLANQLTALRLDLVFLTGDYMHEPGDEAEAHAALRALTERLRPSIGVFGVFGNHDSDAFRERCRDLPVHWLYNSVYRFPRHPIELLGLGQSRNEEPDAVALAIALDATPAPPPLPAKPRRARHTGRPLRLLLAHYPSCITTAADLGVDVMFSGHTHGGQIRLPVTACGKPLVNACDLPLKMTAGLLRHRNTLAAISRGLGEAGFLPHRFWCPPHAPVYTFRTRTIPGRCSDTIELLRAW